MERRRILEAIGTAATLGIAGLAGCGSPGDGPAGTPGEGSPIGGSPGGTPTPGETTPAEGTETPGEEGTPGGTDTPGEDGTAAGTGTPGAGGASSVDMLTDGDEYIFDPIGLYVEPGTEVTFVNQSGSHSSTAYAEGNPQAETTRIPEDAEGWDSGIISSEGEEFSHTFEVEGTYDYYCTPHKSLGMVGRIVVGSPGGPAEGSMPPDGDVPESSAIVDQGSISYDDFAGG